MTMHLRIDPSICPGRRPAWTLWMCSLFWGCIVSSVWSSSNVASSASSSSSVSQAQYEHHFHGSKHHSVPISIYRSPVSLRGGHGGFPLLFLSNLFAEQSEQRRGSRADAVSAGRGVLPAPVFLPFAPLPITLQPPLPSRARARAHPASGAPSPAGVSRGAGGLGSLLSHGSADSSGTAEGHPLPSRWDPATGDH